MSTDPITDTEVKAFVAEVEAFERRSAGTLADERAAYEAIAARFAAPRPPGLSVRDASMPGPAGAIPVRRYRPVGAGDVRVVYFHGGGFVVGGLESHDDVCAELAQRTACEVVAVDYRLAPEHVHPAQVEDACAAARAVLAEGPVVLAGDSAGGALAAATALALKGSDIRGQVLVYPTLGGEARGLGAYEERGGAPLLTTADVHRYQRRRAGGEPPLDDPSFAPLAAGDAALRGVAPCFASGACVDPLRDDAVEYVRRLIGAGVPATCVVEPQLPHMWIRARHRSRRAGEAFDRVVEAVAELADPARAPSALSAR